MAMDPFQPPTSLTRAPLTFRAVGTADPARLSDMTSCASPWTDQERVRPTKRKSDESHAPATAGKSTTAKRLACDVCRERKVRCDRGQPKCGRCTRLGHECGYNAPVKAQADQVDVPRVLSVLHERLAQAEARLALPSAPVLDFNTCASTTLPAQGLQMNRPMNAADFSGFTSTQSTSPDPSFDSMSGDLIFDESALLTDILDSNHISPIVGTGITQSPLEATSRSQGCNDYPRAGLEFQPRTGPLNADEEIPSQVLAILHQNYFDVAYAVSPLLNRARFFAQLQSFPLCFAVSSLSYAVALSGAAVSQEHAHWKQRCYNLARKYVDMCEREENEANLVSIDVLQALALIIRYELKSNGFARAWMTLGRAVRLAKLMGLDQMDQAAPTASSPDFRLSLPPTYDLAELEERRRTFWTLYIYEGYASVRTGSPCAIDEARVSTALPSPGDFSDAALSVPMPSLHHTSLLFGTEHVSSYAGIICMVSLYRRCFDHLHVLPHPRYGFWDRHYRIVKAFDECNTQLLGHFGAQVPEDDPLVFGLHLNMCAIDICLHEAAIAEAEKEGLPEPLAAEGRKRSEAAALKIANIIRLNRPSTRFERDVYSLTGTFLIWPLVMGMKALSRLLSNPDPAGNGNNVIDSLRLLCWTVEEVEVEEPSGPWRSLIVAVTASLAELEKRKKDAVRERSMSWAPRSIV
ncbi:MAG: hypothetical protein M1816_000512 [Peltula sp. TS41687]|nr:MAG: hypothetical protein M1816_000512 [Peltula sp. TS41687]